MQKRLTLVAITFWLNESSNDIQALAINEMTNYIRRFIDV